MDISLKHRMVGVLILLSSVSVSSQDTQCDQLQPLAGSFEYKYRGNRCEGLYVAKVGANALEFVSLTQGRLEYELKSGVVLGVSVFSKAGPIHIRAVSKIPNTYYRMDALLQPGSTLQWTVNDVLLPQGLGADRIGVFAWSGDENDRTILPVQVAMLGVRPTKPKNVYLSVRPTFDVEKIVWRSATMTRGNCSVFGEWKHSTRDQALGGQPVDIVLDALSGPTCVEVAARAGSSNEWSTLSLRLELTPQ